MRVSRFSRLFPLYRAGARHQDFARAGLTYTRSSPLRARAVALLAKRELVLTLAGKEPTHVHCLIRWHSTQGRTSRPPPAPPVPSQVDLEDLTSAGIVGLIQETRKRLVSACRVFVIAFFRQLKIS